MFQYLRVVLQLELWLGADVVPLYKTEMAVFVTDQGQRSVPLSLLAKVPIYFSNPSWSVFFICRTLKSLIFFLNRWGGGIDTGLFKLII